MSAGLYQNKGIIKAHLMSQFKAYRNLSVKTAVGFWIAAMVSHFIIKVLESDHMTFNVEETIYQSFMFSLAFAVGGYFLGAGIGTFLQKQRIGQIRFERERKKRAFEEQMSIRQARLELMNEAME